MDKDKENKDSLENLDDIVGGFILLARYYKDKYDALVGAGFTEIQALEILKARGINP